MFYTNQSSTQQNKYKKDLQIIGSLSNLFSSSQVPYLYYRIAENIFCKAFSATDLSRGDTSYDAQKNLLGIGLKTFLKQNDKTLQKIAEFNKMSDTYTDLDDKQKIIKIAELRNERLRFANRLYGINSSIYHCVLRDQGKFYLHEESISEVNINLITDIKRTRSSIQFNDSLHEYSFSLSKSTLMKRFYTDSIIDEIEVNILKDPLDLLSQTIDQGKDIDAKFFKTVYLPLYGKNGKVYTKSGLNQWNAGGRDRVADEVYIPIPKQFYKYNRDFFPPKDTIFELKLPNGEIISAKVCQDSGKALMSNPNKVLGKWILRDLFQLAEGELVTNEIFEKFGIDSVKIDKIDDLLYQINFAKIGSYEEFNAINYGV